jgi:acetoin:2,6-dichlorophenolindophenol oxidoreductase subunit beta
VEKTGRLVVVDEDNPRCGMAADIAALVAQNCFDDLQAPVQMVTAPHTPPPFTGSLEDLYVPSADKIGEAVRRTTGGKVGAGA